MEADNSEPLVRVTIVAHPKDAELRALLCWYCHHVSWNQNDVENLYCGFCHKFGVLDNRLEVKVGHFYRTGKEGSIGYPA